MTELGRRADAETVHGQCAPRFERLRDALADALATGAEVGAALAPRPAGGARGGGPGFRSTARVSLPGGAGPPPGGGPPGPCRGEARAGPAGTASFIGLPAELDARCAELIPPPASPEGDALRRQLGADPASLSGLALMRVNAYRNPPEVSGTGVVNTRAWRAAEVPSTNGHGNARAVARLYSALAADGRLDGVRVLSPDIIARACAPQVYGDDIVLQRPTRFGLGFQLTMAERPLGPNPRAFGHFGAGGSLGFADPDGHVAFGYAMNQGRGGWQHKHVRRFIDLVYAAL